MITLQVRTRLHVRVKERFRNIVDSKRPLVHNCQLSATYALIKSLL
jgi:hypothetical protein